MFFFVFKTIFDIGYSTLHISLFILSKGNLEVELSKSFSTITTFYLNNQCCHRLLTPVFWGHILSIGYIYYIRPFWDISDCLTMWCLFSIVLFPILAEKTNAATELFQNADFESTSFSSNWVPIDCKLTSRTDDTYHGGRSLMVSNRWELFLYVCCTFFHLQYYVPLKNVTNRVHVQILY